MTVVESVVHSDSNQLFANYEAHSYKAQQKLPPGPHTPVQSPSPDRHSLPEFGRSHENNLSFRPIEEPSFSFRADYPEPRNLKKDMPVIRGNKPRNDMVRNQTVSHPVMHQRNPHLPPMSPKKVQQIPTNPAIRFRGPPVPPAHYNVERPR